MSNDKKEKPSIDEILLQQAKEKYERENDETKELLKEKGITIEKAIELYPLTHLLEFYYIAHNYSEDDELDEDGEYYESLRGDAKMNYTYLEEVYNDLTKEEKIVFRRKLKLSYLADVYDDIKDYEDALDVICLNVKGKTLWPY